MNDERPRPGLPKIVAFTSPANGIGRTSVVANLAWVLAASGSRVAIADWGTEPPHVHDFLRPFHTRTTSFDDLLDQVLEQSAYSSPARMLLSEDAAFPQLQAHRYRLPVGTGRLDVVATLDLSTPVRGFGPQHNGTGEVEVLRAGIKQSAYDYMLIDSPANLSPEVATRLARLCDIVAVCFTTSNESIHTASAFATEVWNRAPVGVRVLAVPVQFDERDETRAKKAKEAINSAFEPLLARQDPLNRDLSAAVVCIPPHQRTGSVETLAVLVGEDHEPAAAFHRLAAAVAEPDAEAGERVSLSAGQLETYRRSVGLSPTQIALEAASEDRPWADWVRSQLLAAGAELVEVPRADTALVRIMSGHAVEPPNQAHGLVVDAVVGEEEADEEDGDTGTTVQVRIAGRTEEAARTELLAALSLTPAARSEAATVRYPNRTGKVRRNLPDRLTSFAGRGTALAAMRDRLTPEPAPRTWWLTGQSGSGKTELAKEFAHRFEFDYEHVWWINARDRATITDSLALLAPLLGVAAENQVTDMVLGELGQASEAQRWLLIFDGADDPAVLAGMLPQQGCGHVVVTSRALPGDLDAEVFEVGPFTAAESFGYLRRELLQASGRLLGQIATLCGQEPLALRLARAWIVEREAQLRQDGESTRSAAFRSASEFCAAVAADESASTVRRVFEVVARTLDQSTLGQLVVRVAEVCSFLADDGVAISLLHKTSMLAAVSTAPDGPELEGLELDAVLWHGVRHGLFTVSWGLAGSLTMDRPILAFARELVPESDLAALRARVQEGLAAVAPSEAEIGSPTSAPDLRELRRHIVPSEADASASTTVRRWLVNQTRFLLDNGGPHTWAFALSLCEKMLGNWAEDVEPDLRLRLRSHLNNLHRVLDNRHDSFSPDESLVADLRERHSQDHVRVLLATRGKAHALRVAGRFTEALAEEHATVLMLRQRIGPDHPETLKANNNLALSMFLDGDAAAALELQLENRDRRMKVLGPDHKDVWWSTCSIGIYRRELGDYAGALRALEDAHMRIQTIADIGPRDRMRVDWHKAITLRLSGDPGRAKEYNSETSLEYGRVFGPDHSDTRACKLSLAADNHALGEFDSAAKTAWECYQSYVRRRGAVHLFTYVSQLDYAIFLEASGRDDANALRHATEAREGLVHTLGNAVHPWALAARLAEAVVIGRTDDARRANLALANVHDDCLEFLGAQHPTTKTARANAALDSNVDQWTYVVLDVPEM